MREPDISAMDRRDISTLLAIMRALRTPVTGCPWDLEQTFSTIAPYTIEEAYEVAAAIASDDRSSLKDELGDLLLQPIYHAQMASEEGSFSFADVIESICSKMIRRHPHVFGDEAARAAPLAKGFWENAKAAERTNTGSSTLAGVTVGLPGLTRAIKLQAKAAKVGFDWPDVTPVFAKAAEELDELREAAPDKRAEELGDLLFVVANLARHFDVDPEAALRGANAKFERRFNYIEEQLAARGLSPAGSNLAEMDALWDEAKEHGF